MTDERMIEHPMTIQQTDRAREILARLEEIDGNKAGAFTLRTEGAVGSVFEAKLAVVQEALMASARDIGKGEDGRS